MVKSLLTRKRPAKAHAATPQARTFNPDEFKADTPEDRSIAVLAEKRRQFLARLQAPESDTASPVAKPSQPCTFRNCEGVDA